MINDESRRKNEEGDIGSARGFYRLSLSLSLSLSLTLSLYRNVPDQQNMIASYISHHTESISDKQEYFHK